GASGAGVARARPWRDDNSHGRIIGLFLAWAVILALLVPLLGAVLSLGHEGRRVADFRVFRGEPWDLRSAPAVMAAAFAGRREAVIQLGVLVLIATPIARVILSLAAFAVPRDRIYVLVTAIVLAVLLYGLFW